MKKFLTILFFIPLLANAQQTLTETFTHNGVEREYLIYIPAIADGNIAVPLLFNFHGFSMTANQMMQFGGDMRPVADTAGFILVYPQGTFYAGGNHWNVGSWTAGSPADDIGFTEAMIDTISANYNIDLTRVYACGYSNGGYFSFELACRLSEKIAAIGSVCGTMSTETFASCNPSHPVPVISIHGTADNIVNYNGGSPINSKSLDEVNAYWRSFNNTDPVITTDLPDINPSDGSTVTQSLYPNGDQCTAVAHYKVIGGGHFWPGMWGNMDIDAGGLIWNFVSKYNLNGLIDCGITSVNEVGAEEDQIFVYPNPASNYITIEKGKSECNKYQLYSAMGKLILEGELKSENHIINLAKINSGMYFLKIGVQSIKVIVSE